MKYYENLDKIAEEAQPEPPQVSNPPEEIKQPDHPVEKSVIDEIPDISDFEEDEDEELPGFLDPQNVHDSQKSSDLAKEAKEEAVK